SDASMSTFGWVPVATKPAITESQFLPIASRLFKRWPDLGVFMSNLQHELSRLGIEVIPDPEPTITESRFMELVEVCSFADGPASYREFCRLAGIEIIPDPEPADEELLAGIIRNIDDWQSITSPELLAKYLNTAGVTPPEEN